MYESDNQTGVVMLFWRPRQQPPTKSLYPGMISIGNGLLQLGWLASDPASQVSGYVPLELVNRGVNSYPQHFHYPAVYPYHSLQ